MTRNRQISTIIRLDRVLSRRYGPQGWWPTTGNPGQPPIYQPGKEGRPVSDREAFEIIVGSILTQNNTWTNAEKALMNLSRAGLLDLQNMAGADDQTLAALIVPARYYNQKAARLIRIATAVRSAGGIASLRKTDTHRLRNTLLAWTGVGPETADSILCYAFGRSVFVVDAYTRRLFRKLGLPCRTDESVQRLVYASIPPSAAAYGDLHARIVKLYTTGDEKDFFLDEQTGKPMP